MAEVIAGAAATASSSGVGAPWAIPLILHGIDQVVAGAAQVVTGEQTHSRLEKIVAATAEAAGVSPQKAEIVGGVVDAVTGLALTAGVGSGQALTRAVATEAKVVNAGAKFIRFGKTENQVRHAFRHTDAMGLDRIAIKQAIEGSLARNAMQVVDGAPFNGVVDVAGKRLQYTAYKLSDGTINVGRIHEIK